jgi:hypothetical protein
VCGNLAIPRLRAMTPSAPSETYAGLDMHLDLEGEQWAGFFTWENIAGWRWRMKTSKSKYRSAADFDLTKYILLLPLLEAVPHAERIGAVVKGSFGLPVRADMYRRWFRRIARASGIPDDRLQSHAHQHAP